MCGIAGFFNFNDISKEQLNRSMTIALDAISHRGPDSHGIWVGNDGKIALGHRRLSIVDLSQNGHQPMTSKDGRFTIAFNGEIYNFREIRQELTDRYSLDETFFIGHSDTEVILASIMLCGLDKTLEKVTGMFAFALWDKETEELKLIRDRIGEKPLYLWKGLNRIFFASELSAIEKQIWFNDNISKKSIELLMRHNFIPAPYSIYENIEKILPGTIRSFAINSEFRLVDNQQFFWDLSTFVNEERDEIISDASALDRLDHFLNRSINNQLMADVSVGTFLSGGYDSSLVSAIAQKNFAGKLKTFSVGFAEEKYNEAKFARDIASHLGTEHAEFIVGEKEMIDIVPKLHQIFSEPFSDSSQIPTYFLSKKVKEEVTVILSGDGGDELFGGYNRYQNCKGAWKKIGLIPKVIKEAVKKGISFGSSFLPKKIQKAANYLAFDEFKDFYRMYISHMKGQDLLKTNCRILTFGDEILDAKVSDFEKMMFWDQKQYLPDDILVKVDRSAMAVSLETRIPLLDHKIIEFSWKLPIEKKMRLGVGKWILKELAYKYIPKPLLDRPKQGFSVPLESWLRGSLRDWAEDLLDPARLNNEGFFFPDVIREYWARLLQGENCYKGIIWDILMFQSWLRRKKEN
jgi:asparagine synthase (glutamine-hydrolysing)